MIRALMGQKYKDGTPLTHMQIAHMLIALLMAGQHTSSTTGTWALLFLAKNPEIWYLFLFRSKIYKEQEEKLENGVKTPLTYENLEKLIFLDNVVRETLRIRPPLLELMRIVTSPMKIPGTKFVIPKGHYIAAAPVITQRDPEIYKNPNEFLPDRWFNPDYKLEQIEADEGYGVIKTTSARSPYLPFGAGRHRCIGEPFAYLQLKTIIAMFVRNFNVDLKDGKFPEIDFTNLVALPCLPASIKFEKRAMP